MSKSITENLANKTVIEYPSIHVVLRNHWKDYATVGTGKGLQNIIMLHIKLNGMKENNMLATLLYSTLCNTACCKIGLYAQGQEPKKQPAVSGMNLMIWPFIKLLSTSETYRQIGKQCKH